MAKDMTFKSEFIDCKKNILIPLLQRDYVQGGRKSVIKPFIGKLIFAVQGKTEVNLNYIYGYDGFGGFIPIDGQQRLITLWLLHLYIYAKNQLEFPVELKFESREFAENFSKELKENLSGILEVDGDIKENIKDSPWFISGWIKDTSVKNMLDTIELIHKEIGLSDIKETNTQNIVFDFLNMKDLGLDDDVYVKMNGRGRPLSYFENLKSWMDEKVKTIPDWQVLMDNDWTDLFWFNRNKNREHPEEIDDEQMRFFYSILLLYWKQNETNFIAEEDDDALKKKKIFKRLLEGEVISLYHIEEWHLFNDKVFELVYDGLKKLYKISDYINDLAERIKVVWDQDKTDTTLLYKIAFKEATYAKTLPMLYALIRTPDCCCNKDGFSRWFRVWRNLILNSSIEEGNLGEACFTIDAIAKEVDKKGELYKTIADLRWERGFGFGQEQFNEEVAKVKQILDENGNIREYNGIHKKDDNSDYATWEELIIDAEKYAFFKGAIRFLFTDDEEEFVWCDFDTKWTNARNYFPQDDSEKYLNTVEFAKYFEDKKVKDLWWNYSFDKKDDSWRKLLLSKNYKQIHDFMLNAPINNTILIEDIKNLTSKLNSSLWIRGWDTEYCFLTNYARQVATPENGYVYMVGSRERNEAICKIDKIDKNRKFLGGYPGPVCEKISNLCYYRGLKVDFKYNDKYFRLWENNTICLMNDDWKDIIYKNQDISGKRESYYFPLDEGNSDMEESLKKLIEDYNRDQQ